MKRILLFLITFFLMLVVVAQEQWNLTRCIDHALTHNITIKQQELNTQYQETLLEQRKYDRLPDLNAGVSQSFGFGLSVDNGNNYLISTSAASNFSLNSRVTVWRAGAMRNAIEQQNYEFLSSLENLDKAKDDMTINIAQAFLKILFSEEVVNVADTQLEQTKIQIKRTKQLVEAGKLAEGVLLEILAQEARESLSLVNAKNSYTMELLNLAQLLELDDYTGFGIMRPMLPEMQAELTLLTSKSVFERAISIRPEIKSAEYQLQSSESGLKIAKAARIPSLNASAGFSDRYYVASAAKFNDSFANQLKDNSQSNIALNLSIPIFNRWTTRSNISNAQIQIESRKLDLEGTKKELRRQIEQAYINALASYERYNANKVAVESMEESFRYMEQKFDLGRVNSVEYNDSKTKLATAQSDLVQAKYEFIFRSKILDFYNGTPIVL